MNAYKRYLKVKAKHEDTVVLFQIGHFYEAFGEDARIVAQELSVTLGSRRVAQKERVLVAGLAFHSLEKQAAELYENGHEVIVASQLGGDLSSRYLIAGVGPDNDFVSRPAIYYKKDLEA